MHINLHWLRRLLAASKVWSWITVSQFFNIFFLFTAVAVQPNFLSLLVCWPGTIEDNFVLIAKSMYWYIFGFKEEEWKSMVKVRLNKIYWEALFIRLRLVKKNLLVNFIISFPAFGRESSLEIAWILKIEKMKWTWNFKHSFHVCCDLWIRAMGEFSQFSCDKNYYL